MPTEMTIEAAMIELNRLKTTERMDIDRDRLTAAIDVLKDAAQFRIKRKPDLKPKPLRNEVFWWQCPNCKAHTHANTMHRYCHYCGQALDWSSL